MLFTELLTHQTIQNAVFCSSKKRALEMIGDIAAHISGNSDNEQRYFESLFNREKLGNTGIGFGIAMPHTKIQEGLQIIAVFLQLETPIDYGSTDNREVDLILAILIPESLCEEGLDFMPQLAQKLTNKSLAKQLRNAQSVEEIWDIFSWFDHNNNLCEKEKA